MLNVGKDLARLATLWIRGVDTYSLLEHCNFFIGQGVGLRDDWDQIDLGVQTAHDFNVKGFEGVTGGLDEVDACVNAVVDNVHSVDLILSLEVGVESLLDVLNDWSPRIVVVDEITEARCVHDCQSESDAIFLDVSTDGLY